MPADSPINAASFRRRRWLGMATIAICVAFSAACSDSSGDKPVVSSIPETTEAPATQAPPSSGQQDAPSGQSGTGGAEPGRDGEEVDPPGGTNSTPDPDGFSGGSSGERVNPDTGDN